MASASQLDLFPLVAPFHDQVFNKRSPLSISHSQRKALLDRLLEISFMFQQQYSAGRGIAITVSHKSKASTHQSDSKKPVAVISGATSPLIARRVAVKKLATRLPFSSTKALHHARRMQLLGRNSWARGRHQQRSLNLLRFTVLGFGGTDPWGEPAFSCGETQWFWMGGNIIGYLMADSSLGGLIEEGPHPVGEPAAIESLPSSNPNGCRYLEDIARYKRAPTPDTGCFNLEDLLDDLDDFALPAAEDSEADSWHLSFR
ncbi:hypothetical protein EYR41_003969 [Orbilia oligospora]|uniref:Uncharacterized protein n=1 Tax=Orbilia oligospora TaxID=2813651 RepID=A0A7C8PDR6_ORBOL|nr:hypothetical protein TWF751_010405 [Orbilia oligospora]TGJ72052.1 hypothetical protein EYR41_003969 [Orbilia oligospora]